MESECRIEQKEKAQYRNNTSGRIAWVDCCKAMAIIAVLVDHTNGILYTNQYIAQASYYSVSLFVLLSGMTHSMLKPERLSYMSRLKKIALLFGQYAVACFVILFYYQKFFDLKTYISSLFSFNLQGPFYFLLFFFQLLLLAPVLVAWCRYCDARKWRYIFHTMTLLALFYLASICIRYTYMLPVHGGGQNLFGGTFIVLFYIGIILGQLGFLTEKQNYCIPVLICSFIMWISWIYLVKSGGVPLDRMLETYLGNGFNPPGVQNIVFTIISLVMFRSVFILFERYKCIMICREVIKFFSLLGRGSLYIFMYHLMVRDIMMRCISVDVVGIWFYRLLVFTPMLIIPVLLSNAEKGIVARFDKEIRM